MTSQVEKSAFPWSKRAHWWQRDGLRQRFADIRPIYINPYTYTGSTNKNDLPLFQIASCSHTNKLGIIDLEAAKQARNRLQNAIITVSIEMTGQHLAGLKATENNANLLLGASAIGLSSGASVMAGVTAKALSASAAGSGGARGLVNEQLYRNNLGESLVRAIETSRAELLETVIRRKQTNSIAAYDVEAAILDAQIFHERGSFYHGLSLVRDAIDKANGQRETTTTNQVQKALDNH